MTAVTTQSQAWVLAAAIAAVVVPLYLAFIFREFVLDRVFDFAGKRFPKATGIVATVATWGRATKRHAAVSTLPPEAAAPSYYMDSIEFDWKVCR